MQYSDYSCSSLTVAASNHQVPYLSLSGFYFFYYASLGALIPYWTLYLESLSFSVIEIGQLMAIFLATKIVAPSLWGWLADVTGQPVRVIRVGALLSAIFFALIFVDTSFRSVLVMMVVFSFFRNAILPQMEAITLSHLQQELARYSNIRLWGSVGFILAVLLLGVLIDQYSIKLVPQIILFLLLALWLSTLLVSGPPPVRDQPAQRGLLKLLKKPNVIVFFIVGFLMQVSHGPYYTFYSIYMAELGYNNTLIGMLWNLGVVAEIGIFWIMHRLMSTFSAKSILLASLLLAGIRWGLIGYYAESLALLLIAQLFHAASFASFHAVCIHFIYLAFPRQHEGHGQALYVSVSFGGGGALGAILAGVIWRQGGAEQCFSGASIICLVAFLIALIWLKFPVHREGEGEGEGEGTVG